MAELLKKLTIVTLCFVSLNVLGQRDSIRVRVGDFAAKSFSKRFLNNDFTLKDFFATGLLRDSVFIIENNSGAANTKKSNQNADFIVTGITNFYDDGFYCEVTVTGRDQQKTTLPAVAGRHRELYGKMDVLTNQLITLIHNKTKKDKALDNIGISMQLRTNGKQELNQDIVNDIFRLLSSALKNNDSFRIVELNKKGSETVSSYVSADTLRGLINFEFHFDRQYNIKILPTLYLTDENSLELPVILMKQNTSYESIKASLQKDFSNLFHYLTLSSGQWDVEKINALKSASSYPEHDLIQKANDYQKDTLEIPGVYYASMAIEKYPESYTGYLALGKIRLKYSRYEDAANALTNAIQMTPNSTDCYIYHGYSNYKLNAFAKSIGSYREALRADGDRDSDYGNLYLLTGQAYLSADSLRQANQLLLQSLDKFPNESVALFYLGVSYNKLFNYKKSIATFDKYLSSRNSPDKNAFQWMGDNYYKLGLKAAIREAYDSSINFLNTAKKYRDDHSVNINILYCLNRMNKFSSVDSLIALNLKKDIFKKDAIYFEEGEDLRNIGDAKGRINDLTLQAKYFKKSVEYLEKHLSLNPEDGQAYWLTGNTYMNLREFNKGFRYLKEGVNRRPSNFSDKLDLAESLIINDRPDEVNDLFKDAMIEDMRQTATKVDFALMIYLKVMANLVLEDRHKTVSVKLADLSNELNAIIEKKTKLNGWYYDIFLGWVKNYTGNNKSTIEDRTLKLKALTINY